MYFEMTTRNILANMTIIGLLFVCLSTNQRLADIAYIDKDSYCRQQLTYFQTVFSECKVDCAYILNRST